MCWCSLLKKLLDIGEVGVQQFYATQGLLTQVSNENGDDIDFCLLQFALVLHV